MRPRDSDPLLPDEPSFTLRGRDPLAGFLVAIWAFAHQGDGEAVAAKIGTMLDRFVPGIDGPDYRQTTDAIDIARAMFAWQARRFEDGTKSIIRESTKSEPLPPAIALHRWTAEIDDRHDDGIRATMRGLHELAELHEIFMAGPARLIAANAPAGTVANVSAPAGHSSKSALAAASREHPSS